MAIIIEIVRYFLESPRPVKRLVTILFDSLVTAICVFLSYWIVKGDSLLWSQKEVLITIITVSVSLVVYVRMGFYRAILRYIGINAVTSILVGISLSSLVFTLASWLVIESVKLETSLLYWSFSLLSVGGSRICLKAYVEGISKGKSTAVIYGAGAAGRQLASVLRNSHRYRPVAFVDDDENLHYSQIAGLSVLPSKELSKLVKKYQVSRVLLALPSATHAKRSEILTELEPLPVKVKTIAGMEDIVSGEVNIEQLKEIEIEDLLGRDSIEPNKNLLELCIKEKSVLVTGAGGSIGSELCRNILRLSPKTLVLYELSEFALYSIERELLKIAKSEGVCCKIVPLMGSVQHKSRVLNALQTYEVQTVYHAAAYKHVPIVEHNIVEGIRNNVFGTWYTAEASIEAGVERFVLVSTDKAVRPTNIMGASKRVAELILQAINDRKEKTIFTMVRFGNVLGSSGSVVPLFRDQIKNGGPVTVTHKDIIRYFMTIPEAALLVIQAGAMGKGGDVFVLDMGEPVRIAELAERMVHLMGHTVRNKENLVGDIEIQYSGLRPGEKLYEELLVGTNVVGTEHSKIMCANEESLVWEDMQRALILLNELCEDMDCEGIVQLLLKIPTGYNPQHKVCDLLWKEDKDRNNVLRFKTLT